MRIDRLTLPLGDHVAALNDPKGVVAVAIPKKSRDSAAAERYFEPCQ
jgi:hypothetical protein